MKYLMAGLIWFGAAGAAEQGMSAAECEVWERERTFAESAAKHDAAAFAAHVHEAAVFGAASAQTQQGREAILKAWAPIIAGKGVSLEWRPQFVSIGGGPNVAMSRGPFVLTVWDAEGKKKIGIGHFVSVWVRKDASSPWMVVLDGGGPPPAPATEEEARKHLESAPAQCPRS
jgi:ketosteroid isomerase-like protein